MQRRALGRTGLRVSRLGLGTMTWGGDTDEHEAREQLTGFLGAGGNLVDTAAGYTDGRSEELLGSLLGSVVPRDEVVIATKAGISRRTGDPGARHLPRDLLATLDASLKRLGVDHVDLWQVHVWTDETPGRGDAGRDRLRGEHRPRGVRRHLQLQRVADGPGRDLAARRAGPGAAGLDPGRVLAGQPQGRAGGAAGRPGPGPRACCPGRRSGGACSPASTAPARRRTRAGASKIFGGFVDAYLDDRGRGIVEATVKAADGLGWTPLQVALVWVRDRPGVTSPIVGARTSAQLQDALEIEDKALPEEISSALDDVSGGPW